MDEKLLVLFDIDGTLLRTPGAGRRAMTRAFFEVFDVEDPFAGYSFQGKTDRGIFIETAQHRLNRTPSEEELQDTCRRYLSFLEPELDACRAEIRVMPGIPGLLQQLLDAGVGVGLATGNLYEGARLKLSAVNLWQYFSYGGFGSDHEHRGELTRKGIQRGRELYGPHIPDSRVFVVGDSPLDVRAARYAGVSCVAVLTGWNTRDELVAETPFALLDDLGQPQPFLRLMGLGIR